MRKLSLIIILLSLLIPTYGKMISKRTKKRKDGKVLVIEKYTREPDGKYKVEKLSNEFYVEKITTYYRNNPDYREKDIEYFERKNISKVIRYYTKDHPDGCTYDIEDYTSEDDTITSYYSNNDNNIKYDILYRNKKGNIYKREIFFNDNDKFYIKVIDYFIDYEKDLFQKEEFYYEKHPKRLYKAIKFNNNEGKREKEFQYYKNHESTLFLIESYYENEILVKEIQNFKMHPVNSLITKIITYFNEGEIIDFKAFDIDGNEINPKEKDY